MRTTAHDKTTGSIDRRSFIRTGALGALGFALPEFPAFSKERAMGIVVHSYGLRWNSKIDSSKYPAFTDALQLIEHCHEIGAGGVQVLVKDWTTDFAKKVRRRREQLGMYIEGSIGLPNNNGDVARFEKEVANAKEAGAQVLRTVCSSGRRYEIYHSAEAFQQLKKNALVSLQLAEPVLRKSKVKLAVENHKDWQASELVQILKQIDSEWIGVTLDFGNSIALLEDPMEVIKTLVPYVFSTHVKDMAVEEYRDGFLLSEVPLGNGILNLSEIISLCKKHNPAVCFNLEMITRDPLEIPCLKAEYWETFAAMPASELARALQMVRRNSRGNLPKISNLALEERLAMEEKNIMACLAYSRDRLGMKV